MKETEVKILDIDEGTVISRLGLFASKVSDRVLLTTTTFKNPYNRATVRIRAVENDIIFTVKVPVSDRHYKIRNEYETKVSDFDVFKKQLEILGFIPAMMQEKKRTTYKYKHSEIVIDQYPQMPAYIEIEGSKEEIIEIVREIGYSMEDTTSISVYGLFKKYNVDATRLVF